MRPPTRRGGTDYLFFPAAQARYVRLASVPKTADWGVSVFEFEPLAARDAARISGLAGKGDAAGAVERRHRHARCRRTGQRRARANCASRWAAPLPIAGSGSVVGRAAQWRAAGGARCFGHVDARSRRIRDRSATSPTWPRAKPLTASELRLTVGEQAGAAPRDQAPAPAEPRARDDADERYEIAAARAHRELFPSSLHAAAGVLDRGRRAGRLPEIDLRRIRQHRSVQGRAAGAAAVARRLRSRGRRSPTTSNASIRCATAGCRCLRCNGAAQPGCADAQRSVHGRTERPAGDADCVTASATRAATHRRHAVAGGASDADESAVAERRRVADPRDRDRRRRRRAPTCASTAACCCSRSPPTDARGASPFGAHGEQRDHRACRRGHRAVDACRHATTMDSPLRCSATT